MAGYILLNQVPNGHKDLNIYNIAYCEGRVEKMRTNLVA